MNGIYDYYDLKQFVFRIIHRTMASSYHCSVCSKDAGTCICSGCKAYFCDHDFQGHRRILLDELDALASHRNDLLEKVDKITSSDELDDRFFAKIDEWQQTTIEKVKRAAELARQQTIKVMNSKKKELKTQFQLLSENSKELRNTKGVIEQDLTRLKQEIHRLSEALEQLVQPSAIDLNTTQSDQVEWYRMIYVEESSACADNQQRRQKSKSETFT